MKKKMVVLLMLILFVTIQTSDRAGRSHVTKKKAAESAAPVA